MAVREPLDEDTEGEDGEEAEGVHGGPGARPAGEDDLGARAPGEGASSSQNLPIPSLPAADSSYHVFNYEITI